MKVVNVHEAKTHLSRLIDQAANGEPFVIAKSGTPVVRVTAVGAPPEAAGRRLGFLKGQAKIPGDFDTMGRDDIERLFSGS